MKLSTLPRGAAKLEYAAVRAPLSVVERQIVTRYLPDDAAMRLGFERLLGSLDTFAGKLLDDETITRRGQALARRSDLIEKATQLEAKAEQRKAQADEELEASTKQAAKDRQDAERKRQANVVAARRKEQADKPESPPAS